MSEEKTANKGKCWMMREEKTVNKGRQWMSVENTVDKG